ncbi:response regulator transcription factor [Advenella mimigardefordensis]|uniref:Two component transcriptional regulator, CheY-like superfamily n=1 Tax=Advenella mimigardefordensis (strain DSM 17166 / LMG 22922 / DPN7) TaxID=1247726 RepID=W0PE99_ADVMD|nr:response regulator transcription factor [Advenella mimigardefordensis]AHG63802.1 two component transcriptional regulator, CheY-like superfamily [Advenella mimigardefordensis DPN7]
MWRCLVIEDDLENARYITKGLTELGHVCVICDNGVHALPLAMESTWDVIILDRMLPNRIDGLSILSSLRAVGRKTPVLVLSALTGIDERVTGLNAGGDDYLVKPFSFSELVARLNALVRRSDAHVHQQRLQVDDLIAYLDKRKAERAGRPLALQPREFRLLTYLMLNANNTVTRTMLLEHVWDYRFDPQSNVIDVQVSRLRKKVDSGSDKPLIHTVRGAGYTLSDHFAISETR